MASHDRRYTSVVTERANMSYSGLQTGGKKKSYFFLVIFNTKMSC